MAKKWSPALMAAANCSGDRRGVGEDGLFEVRSRVPTATDRLHQHAA